PRIGRGSATGVVRRSLGTRESVRDGGGLPLSRRLEPRLRRRQQARGPVGRTGVPAPERDRAPARIRSVLRADDGRRRGPDRQELGGGRVRADRQIEAAVGRSMQSFKYVQNDPGQVIFLNERRPDKVAVNLDTFTPEIRK